MSRASDLWQAEEVRSVPGERRAAPQAAQERESPAEEGRGRTRPRDRGDEGDQRKKNGKRAGSSIPSNACNASRDFPTASLHADEGQSVCPELLLEACGARCTRHRAHARDCRPISAVWLSPYPDFLWPGGLYDEQWTHGTAVATDRALGSAQAAAPTWRQHKTKAPGAFDGQSGLGHRFCP